jgi:hypothetical protein
MYLHKLHIVWGETERYRQCDSWLVDLDFAIGLLNAFAGRQFFFLSSVCQSCSSQALYTFPKPLVNPHRQTGHESKPSLWSHSLFFTLLNQASRFNSTFLHYYMSSAKPSGGTVHGHATPRRFHSPTFGSPAGIVVRPTRSQSPVQSTSTPTKRFSDISHRKRVVSLTPTLGTPSHVTPASSTSTPLISQLSSHTPSSLDLNDHKSSIPLKEFEKVSKEVVRMCRGWVINREAGINPASSWKDRQFLWYMVFASACLLISFACFRQMRLGHYRSQKGEF